MALSGREKATIFLSILGAENSARILRYLPEELADLIASGINHLPSASPEALSEVLSDFKSFVALPESERAVPPPQIEERPRPVRPKRSYAVLMYERPQVAAFLISLLPEDQREDALLSFSREKGVVSELLSGLRKNPLTSKIGEKLREQFMGKVFS
ncbi:MAG: hypothetical protein ABIH22_03895 [Candidatus Margulisiibacteriota bacterium]